MSNAPVSADVAAAELDPHEYRVVSVEPITDAQGHIEVVAAYRRDDSDRIDRHRFTFGYHYLGENRELSLGLGEWTSPSETVGALDMSVLKYVIAYFGHHRVPVDVSIPLREYEVNGFDADAELKIDSEAPRETGGDS